MEISSIMLIMLAFYYASHLESKINEINYNTQKDDDEEEYEDWAV